jgi:hypothetical protein
MTLFRVLLTTSLAANLVLAAAMYWRWTTRVSRPLEEMAAALHAPRAEAWLERVPAAPVDPATWQRFASAEPAELVARLGDEGYPPAVVRAIVHAQIRQQFSVRYTALADEAAAAPYWLGSAFSLSADPKIERARRALDREAAELAAQLLGPSAGELSESERRMLRREFGDLSPEKVAEMRRIVADYEDLIAEVRGEARGLMLPEDVQRLAYLEGEKRADLARLLSPEELEIVDLRSSPTAGQLRRELAAFEPTEAEFRALFRIQHALDVQHGAAAGELTPEQRARRLAAQKELAGQIEAALGPERYAEYRRTTDPTWLTAHRFVEQIGLPATATAQLVAVQSEITQRVGAVRTSENLTPAQQQAQVALLAQEAHARLAPVLGDRGLAAYKQGIGYWLHALQVPPTPRPSGR